MPESPNADPSVATTSKCRPELALESQRSVTAAAQTSSRGGGLRLAQHSESLAQPVISDGRGDPDDGLFEEQSGVHFAPDMHDARHLSLKLGLLCVWAAVSFGSVFFARDLQFFLGPWPLGYWVASQGAVLVFILIVGVYCAVMTHFERQDRLRSESARNPSEQGDKS